MDFDDWLDTLINEKDIDTEQVMTVQGASGPNMIPIECLVDALKQAPASEQKGIKDMLVKIDFQNGDVVDYFKHLAQAIAI